MTLKKEKIQKIIDFYLENKSIQKTSKTLRIPRNTVKKYLRQYGLLSYSYSSLQHTGPPSLYYQSSKWTTDEQQWIKQLLDKVQMGYSPGGNLIKELDKKNLENEQLRQKVTEVTTDLETVNEEKQNLTQQLEKQKNENKHLIDELETEKWEKEKLQKTVDEVIDLHKKMKQDHQKELEKEKTNNKRKDHEIITIKQKFLDILTERNDKLTTAENEISLLNKNYKIITEERDKLKDEVWSLKMKQKNAPIFTTTVGVIGFGAGAAVGWWLRGKNQTLPISIEYAKNPEYYAIPYQEDNMIQPDMQGIRSGMTPDINTSGALNCSGAYLSTVGNNTDADDADFPYQDRVIGTASGITNSTNTSIDANVGAFFSLQTDPLQDVKPIHEYTPPPLIIPRYSLTFTPPDNPSDSPLMQQLLMTGGKQFEVYIGRFFIYQGYRVTFTKAGGDYGADLVIERDGVRTVVECKQRRENIRTDAVQAVHSAKDVYDAPHALIISTSRFTKPALNLAKIHDVKCWDARQLLVELYKHQFFYSPE